jgi:hypothetical protein
MRIWRILEERPNLGSNDMTAGGQGEDRRGAGKQPYAIALADRRLMALAGLWENWRSPAGEWIRSFAIITTEPNELCAALHNRMDAPFLCRARHICDLGHIQRAGYAALMLASVHGQILTPCF